MAVRIVTDSACDLTEDKLSALGIEVVPLSIRFGEEVQLDREELSIDDFYRRMDSSEHLPQTAAPSPGAFAAAFGRQFEAGANVVDAHEIDGNPQHHGITDKTSQRAA